MNNKSIIYETEFLTFKKQSPNRELRHYELIQNLSAKKENLSKAFEEAALNKLENAANDETQNQKINLLNLFENQKETKNFPKLTKDEVNLFKRYLYHWSSVIEEEEEFKFPESSDLTNDSFRLLGQGHWLNDEVIVNNIVD